MVHWSVTWRNITHEILNVQFTAVTVEECSKDSGPGIHPQSPGLLQLYCTVSVTIYIGSCS